MEASQAGYGGSSEEVAECSRFQDLGQLSPTDIAELSRREFEKQLRQPVNVEPADGIDGIDRVFNTGSSLHSPAQLGGQQQSQLQGFTREQFELKLQEEAEKEKGPMTGAQFRQQQALGIKPELANAQARAPPTYEEFLATNYPHLLQQEEESKKQNPQEQSEILLSEEELLRLQALKELDRSQMPAVADKDHDGLLVKTIEHYTFADGEDSVSFYVQFDKDLFAGAAAFIQENQVKVESRPTSLSIRLQEVPVSAKNAGLLAEWRLSLSPLFGRVEASLSSHKVRNGKLSIKLFKAKQGPWKKGVKYS